MTRVDFYELPDQDEEARTRFACRLALRGRDAKLSVLLLTRDEAAAQDLDDLMWQYPRERFLPHSLGEKPEARSQVHISVGQLGEMAGEQRLLINLLDEPPEGWDRFSRVAEIIVAASRATSREKYRYYRAQVKELHHHRLEDWEA